MKSKLLCSLLIISIISSLSVSAFANEPIDTESMTVGESQTVEVDSEESEEVITIEGFEGTLGEDAEPIPFTEEELKDIERFYSENALSANDVMTADFGEGWTQVTNAKVSPYIKIAMLKLYFPSGVKYGTGASVGSGVVLTAAHCLKDPYTGEEPDRIELFFGRNGRDFYVNTTSTSWQINPKYTGYEPKNDFGIIRVSTSVTSKTGGFGLTTAKPPANNISLTGYPYVKGSANYTGLNCYTDRGNITTFYSDGTMQHNMYCTNCDSGAPIYNNNYIYGIHSGDRDGIIGGISKRVDSDVLTLVRNNKV